MMLVIVAAIEFNPI